jgi:hypothetical protein
LKRKRRRPRSSKRLKINNNPLSLRSKKSNLKRKRKRSLKLLSLKSSGPTLRPKHAKRDPLDTMSMSLSALTMERQTRNITGLRASRVLTFRSNCLKALPLKILRLKSSPSLSRPS